MNDANTFLSGLLCFIATVFNRDANLQLKVESIQLPAEEGYQFFIIDLRVADVHLEFAETDLKFFLTQPQLKQWVNSNSSLNILVHMKRSRYSLKNDSYEIQTNQGLHDVKQ